MSMKIPMIMELMAAYGEISKIERAKNDRPSSRTVTNVLTGVRQICSVCGIDGKAPVTALTRQMLDQYVATAEERGHTSLTAWTYLHHLQALVARWTHPYYHDRGWTFPAFELPVCRKKFPRYIRPRRETLLKVRDWYDSLAIRSDKRDWLAATLMLEFAMRNGDVGCLRWGQFMSRRVECPVEAVSSPTGRLIPFLCYTPHKTSLSSGRQVTWPVAESTWQRISSIRSNVAGDLVVPGARHVFQRLNVELRQLRLFTGSKACYELRKICIDHIYQRFGAERASAISGDDIRTVTRYYADPSAAYVTDVRVVDLL